MKTTLTTRRELLQMKVPFRISGRVFDMIPVLHVELAAGGHVGRGEAAGVYYTQETADTIQADVERVRAAIEAGVTRESLRALMPAGGARNAVDCALWDLESAQQGLPVWQLAGLAAPVPLRTTLTLGADAPEAMARQAVTELREANALKLKLTGDVLADIARLVAVREARPDAWLSVDANQGYSPRTIAPLLPQLVRQRVAMLEQPFARGREADMREIAFPVPVGADESCLDLSELDRVAPLFDVVNIKLDKCGGLTEGLLMARRAQTLGLQVMVGNMGGSSLAMAPALVLGQLCEIVDLDGPFFLKRDVAPGVRYAQGTVSDPAGLWGNADGARRMTAASRAGTSAGDWFGQPRGLTVLFLTEMWEKFSFFGMRALQVYYMTKQLHFSQATASLVYGGYAAGVYLTPLFGGMISDRWLGKHRAVVIGGLLMALGHFMMASEPLFFPAMVAIALGNGLFLPNLPSQVAGLYAADDPRRASAYNIYYVGINLGAFLAPLACGTVGELWGWHYGFAVAGVGMCAGLAVYLLGSRHLPRERPPARDLPPPDPVASPRNRRNLALLLATGLAVVLFRSAYEQTGNTLAVWSDTSLDRALFGWRIPVTWFQSLNPMFVFLLSPLLVASWNARARRRPDAWVSGFGRMAIGAFGVAASYVLLAAVIHLDAGVPTHWAWLVVFFALFTLAELYILPVGLGLFARLAPGRFGATTIAAWFLAAFAGNLLSGVAGVWWDQVAPDVFFLAMAGIAALSGALLCAVAAVDARAPA